MGLRRYFSELFPSLERARADPEGDADISITGSIGDGLTDYFSKRGILFKQ